MHSSIWTYAANLPVLSCLFRNVWSIGILTNQTIQREKRFGVDETELDLFVTSWCMTSVLRPCSPTYWSWLAGGMGSQVLTHIHWGYLRIIRLQPVGLKLTWKACWSQARCEAQPCHSWVAGPRLEGRLETASKVRFGMSREEITDTVTPLRTCVTYVG